MTRSAAKKSAQRVLLSLSQHARSLWWELNEFRFNTSFKSCEICGHFWSSTFSSHPPLPECVCLTIGRCQVRLCTAGNQRHEPLLQKQRKQWCLLLDLIQSRACHWATLVPLIWALYSRGSASGHGSLLLGLVQSRWPELPK